MLAAISERNRQRFGESTTPERALILARPSAARQALKDVRRDELDRHELAPLRATRRRALPGDPRAPGGRVTDRVQVAIPQVLVFVGGLHRSGTSLVQRCLASHPEVSGFSGTGVPEDEGQHLQSVYPQDFRLGGAGRFGFRSEARLTERSVLVSAENRARLLAEWGPHWQPGAAVGVEKSPPNVVRTRFLQALFPNAVFVIVMRHPVAVAGATRKGRRRLLSYELLVRHWVACHTILARDAPLVRNLQVVRYEHLVADPGAALAPVFAAVSLAAALAACAHQAGPERGLLRPLADVPKPPRPL